MRGEIGAGNEAREAFIVHPFTEMLALRSPAFLRTAVLLMQMVLCLAAGGSGLAAQEPLAKAAEPGAMIESITFDAERGKLYAPLAEAAEVLGWTAVCGQEEGSLFLNGSAIPPEDRRLLADRTELITTAGLEKAGASVALHPSGQSATLTAGDRQFTLLRAEKRVEVSLGEQRLRAWQGSRLVLETKVSTGRNGRTPPGRFQAGPYKARMHRSSRYHNAPMPWSVQINGPVFIHGFTSVPDYPASHGCIRVPLSGSNPARFFYEWVDRGTPVRVLPVPAKKKDSLTKSRPPA